MGLSRSQMVFNQPVSDTGGHLNAPLPWWCPHPLQTVWWVGFLRDGSCHLRTRMTAQEDFETDVHSLSHQIPQEWWDKGCVYCSHNVKKTITAKTTVDFQCKWSHSTQWKKKKSRHWADRVYFLALSTWTSLNAGVNLTRQEKPSGLGKSYHFS